MRARRVLVVVEHVGELIKALGRRVGERDRHLVDGEYEPVARLVSLGDGRAGLHVALGGELAVAHVEDLGAVVRQRAAHRTPNELAPPLRELDVGGEGDVEVVRDEVGVDVQPHGVREHGKGTERPRPVVRLRGAQLHRRHRRHRLRVLLLLLLRAPVSAVSVVGVAVGVAVRMSAVAVSVGVAAITVAVGVAAATAVPRSIAIPATLSSVVLGVTPALLHLLHASGDLAIDALAVLLIQLVGLTVLEIVARNIVHRVDDLLLIGT